MNPETILLSFIGLRALQHICERSLSYLNKNYYQNQSRLSKAAEILNISSEDIEKTKSYSTDKYWFGAVSSWITLPVVLLFIYWGGFSYVERYSMQLNPWPENSIITGLIFIAGISFLSSLLSLPFELYYTFSLEQKHGFNRQNLKGFFSDKLKGLILGSVLGGLILYLLLFIMDSMGSSWFIYAWLTIFAFSLLTAWLYPTLLAPLFNKFSPLDEGELKDGIFKLAKKVDFKTDGISIMDASTRSSHGNAYFTGVFGKKKIVLFDTLVKSMSADEVVAVLAHELGHFKLNHIRWALIRSFFVTGIIFYLISLTLPLEELYSAFGFQAKSNYAALVIFSLCFGPVSFLLQPLGSYLSRKNEFAADAFALENIDNKRLLGDALLKLRENSQVMPITHPLFSAVYYSHPPLLERLSKMGYS